MALGSLGGASIPDHAGRVFKRYPRDVESRRVSGASYFIGIGSSIVFPHLAGVAFGLAQRGSAGRGCGDVFRFGRRDLPGAPALEVNGSQGFHITVLNNLRIASNGTGSIYVSNSYLGRGLCLIVYTSPSLSAVLTTRPI
jgi:hypothetical protein